MSASISTILTLAVTGMLAACSGETPVAAPVRGAAAPAAVSVQAAFLPPPPAPRMLAAAVNVLVTPSQVTESERVAEELRLVDFEQSFAVEMNRRNQEQSERSARAAAAVRAGVLQGPGCEGTEGHAAELCEQSLM
jgi:hypothetical protein